MSRKSQLYQLMSENLPNITYQKRLSYRTSRKEVLSLFRLINKEIFNDKLPTPKIEVMARCRRYWGYCIAKNYYPVEGKSNCTIRLSDKWYCKQWLIIVLAHEMCHQYQWDIESLERMQLGREPLMSHGPSFFKFKNKLAKHNIPLNKSMSIKKWFQNQNHWRC